MTKKGAVMSIIIWSCVVVILLGVLLMGVIFSGQGFSFWSRGELREVFAAEEGAAAFDRVEISWNSGNVNITQSADDRMRLKQTSRYDVSPIEYKVAGGELTIREKSDWGFFFFGFGMRSSDLELSLPKKQYEEFQMKMTSGKTAMNAMAVKKMQLTMTSGTLEANNLQVGSLATTVTSGQMIVDTVQADSLSFNLTSGDVHFGGTIGDITGSTTSGDVDIVTDKTPKTC